MCRAASPEKGGERGKERTKQGQSEEEKRKEEKEGREKEEQGRRASTGDPDVVKVAGPVQGSGAQKKRRRAPRREAQKQSKRGV